MLDGRRRKRHEPLQVNTGPTVTRNTGQRAAIVLRETLARSGSTVATLSVVWLKAPAVSNPPIPPDKMHDTGAEK